MNRRPLVSMITIFWNAERFFAEAIESVLAQTYTNWELLLVDDGSTDGSTALAQGYASCHPQHIRYLEHAGHENRGMSAARNLGLLHASGEYIGFLDADDVLVPQKLERQVALLETLPDVDMVYGRTRMWFSWTGKPEDAQRDYLIRMGVPTDTIIQSPALLTLYVQDIDTTPGCCSVLTRRHAIERVGGYEESFRHVNDDNIFYTKLLLHSAVYVQSTCEGWYRQHPHNSVAIAIQTKQWHPAQPSPTDQAYLDWIAAYLKAQDVQDSALWKALDRARWRYRHPRQYRLFVLPYLFAVAQGKQVLDWLVRCLLPAHVYRGLWLRWHGYSPYELR